MVDLYFDLDVPDNFKYEDKKRLGDAVVEFIYDRTTDLNLDKKNKAFKGYKKSYIDSLDFSNAGKSPKDVNLELSGDMLAELKMFGSAPSGKIRIGYTKKAPKEIRGRVEGNITGIRGKTDKVINPRDFLGITKTDYKNILKVIEQDVKQREQNEKKKPKETGKVLDLVFDMLAVRLDKRKK